MKKSMLSRILGGKHSKRDKPVTLVVKDGGEGEETRIRVSRSALAEHSAAFRELKKGGKIVMEEVTSVALHKIVEYVQKSSATFLTHSEALETLSASTKYGIDGLTKICVDNLVTVLDADNVCDVYETATTASHQNVLEYHCLRVIDREAESVLRSRGFTSLRKATALAIVKRTSLQVDSEMAVFQAVMGWGLNACLRQGGDPDDPERFLPLVKYLLNYVRFQSMTDQEIRNPEVLKYHMLLTASVDQGPFQARTPPDPVFKDRSFSTSSSCSLVAEPHPRLFVTTYTHLLDLIESSHHQLKTGDSFSLTIEVLKGKIFLTGIGLALKPFAKRAACLYVAVTTSADVTTRGTFSSDQDARLRFSEPLVARENERVSLCVSVKRAENVSLWVVKEEVQIAMPDSKAVAFKVTPDDGKETCILKEIEYFF